MENTGQGSRPDRCAACEAGNPPITTLEQLGAAMGGEVTAEQWTTHTEYRCTACGQLWRHAQHRERGVIQSESAWIRLPDDA
jgi:hypothetical protein